MRLDDFNVSSIKTAIDIIFDSYINLEKHVMNTCRYSHTENSNNTGTVCLKTKLRYLLLLLFHPSWIFAKHFYMGYHNRFSKG